MTLEELKAYAEEIRTARQTSEPVVRVCTAAGCQSCGGDQVLDALREAAGDAAESRVKGAGCLGLCAAGPMATRDDGAQLYTEVQPEQAAELLATDGSLPACPSDMPFFARQERIVLENAQRMDPDSLDDYLAWEGYQALAEAVSTRSPQEILQEVDRSGMRGRGGGGYPTGLKWATVAKAEGDCKYVVCNADEGDPGAFMDRSILESDPHRILEGMALAAYAVGARQGYIYVRAEYPLAIKRLRQAIKQATKAGLLGSKLCESAFSFDIDIRLGAGAFVCGEETALLASIEGKRGTPRPRPPYPAEFGLWGCPTLINNVESYAGIAPIIRNGGDWYAGFGTEKSKGTKVFALAGRINHTGLIEVPMGISLREIIEDIGGGIPEGRAFKAVQTGGPSGGCIPAEHLDMPVDYESLATVGSIMGSGGMIVMDETSCMVDVAKYFMEFCMSESCGKCVPCRAGTAQMYHLLDRITRGEATLEDLSLLEELCEMVGRTSLCGLGQTAPNPVLSTLRFFRDEYIAHIEEHRCPAGVCKIQRAAEVHS